MRAILFLDFDGVLHPQHDGEPTPIDQVFCHLPRFEELMREFPRVEIVISSSWRRQFPLDQLRARFSREAAARIVGVTPEIEDVAGSYLYARREEEILAWLRENEGEDVKWLALDDAAWQFRRHRDCLVSCTWHTGLDNEAARRLRAALRKLHDF